MTRYLAITIVLLGFLAGSLAYLLKREVAKTGAQQETIKELNEALAGVAKARERDAKVLSQRSREKAALARELAGTARKLADATARNREWADAPVPKEVQDAIDE